MQQLIQLMMISKVGREIWMKWKRLPAQASDKKETADHELSSFYEQSSPLQLFFPDYILLIELMNRHFSSKYRNLFFFVALPLPKTFPILCTIYNKVEPNTVRSLSVKQFCVNELYSDKFSLPFEVDLLVVWVH